MPVADHGTQSVARSHDAGIRNTAGTELENCILLDLRWQIQRYGRFTAGANLPRQFSFISLRHGLASRIAVGTEQHKQHASRPFRIEFP